MVTGPVGQDFKEDTRGRLICNVQSGTSPGKIQGGVDLTVSTWNRLGSHVWWLMFPWAGTSAG